MSKRAFQANQANLKRLVERALYELLYRQYTSPLLRGQITRELENHIPKIEARNSRNRFMKVPDPKNPKFKVLENTIWEIEQADMKITQLQSEED